MDSASTPTTAPVLDVLDVGGSPSGSCRVRSWRPSVPGISEVLHAQLVDYSYPLHAHDTWTVLIVDAGAIRYDLDRRQCGVSGSDHVAVLPPGVIHDGRAAENAPGFRKRNLYLEPGFLPASLIGAAVDHTTLCDGLLHQALSGIHDVLDAHEEPLNAEARLALIGERLTTHLAPGSSTQDRVEPQIARNLRTILDERPVEAITLREAAHVLDRSVPHLVRCFSRTFGVSPHAYIIGRRVETARKLLLAGMGPADVAVQVGFYDQAHFTRHFRRHTSTTPAAFAVSHR